MSEMISACAKLNLTLDFAGKREDGYHLLRMVMQSVSLCDRIRLDWETPGIRVFCGRRDVPCGETNTVYRAASVFFEYSGISPRVAAEVEKRIPSQAGMGGGSADAAAVLRALNRHYGTGYSARALCELGVKVGADVPFCVMGGTALAEGIGEILTPLEPMPHAYFVVCKPPAGVNTGKAFALADSSGIRGNATRAMLAALKSESLRRVAESLGNDFERVVGLPEIALIQTAMRGAGALGACMTGSGSAVFGVFETEDAARRCEERLHKRYADVFLCEPVPAYGE
ncbi:MAG: 4-(cytidine 5'-diphospho)-2-C-methyl-D-erythritol kinase [Clostridiales bacterium]|nr:4-(cytidine 5'-diphospho)-2-C-methyl-D-erythritol kinase [Clostridiales bacterium]